MTVTVLEIKIKTSLVSGMVTMKMTSSPLLLSYAIEMKYQ